MPTFTLTDVARDHWVETFSITAAELGSTSTTPWSVTKRTLRGGRRDGVDLIQVNNGVLSFSVLPTRGMGIWKGQYAGDHLGWESPVRDGPVNPKFVNLMNNGGLGWLEGFDELLVRCGLENNGAPYEVKTIKPDGSESHTTFGLHGKIANTPASYAAVRIETEPAESITIEGIVEEASLFSSRIRMATAITTTPGSNRVLVRDRYLNLGDSPSGIQVLYHWNFAAPYLEEGRAWSHRSRRSSRAIHVPRRDSIITTSLTHRRRASPSRSTSWNCMARPSTAGPWPCSATARGTRRWFCGSRGPSSPRSPSGKTPAGSVQATLSGSSRRLTTPIPDRSSRPARGSSRFPRTARTTSRRSSKCSTPRKPCRPSRLRSRRCRPGPSHDPQQAHRAIRAGRLAVES